MKSQNLLGIFFSISLIWVSYAGTVARIHPKNAVKGESITITLTCRGTSFTTDAVTQVRLSGKGLYNADSFNVLSDTAVEAVFDFTGSAIAGVFSAVIVTGSEDIVAENAFTLLDPDINGDGIIDMLDHKLFTKYFLEIMPGYAAVPDLAGLSQIQAVQQIENMGFDVGLIKSEVQSNTPLDTVTGQYPPAGKPYPKNTSVVLTVSLGIEWVYIQDPGVSGREGFNGYMSKYETNNAQYCQFLNEALSYNKIRVENNTVYGNGGTYANLKYFSAYSQAAPYSQITYSGGKFTVRVHGGRDMSSHPAGSVSWYGAKAFCEHYGCSLPTEWQWQAAADYDGSYIYGCGTEITSSLANYNMSNPLGFSNYPFTSPVGYYGEFGYGLCDLAGNLHEWVDSFYITDPLYPILRGGDYLFGVQYCNVSYRYTVAADKTNAEFGFRVVRN